MTRDEFKILVDEHYANLSRIAQLEAVVDAVGAQRQDDGTYLISAYVDDGMAMMPIDQWQADREKSANTLRKLPRTADGVPVVPGMILYDKQGNAKEIDFIDTKKRAGQLEGRNWTLVEWCDSSMQMYSTAEAPQTGEAGEGVDCAR